MQHSDAQAYAAGTTDAAVKRFAHLPLAHYTAELVSEMIDGVIADGLRNGDLALLTIADSQNNEFMGSFAFFDITPHSAEVGYWVAPEHRGRNVSTQALSLAIALSRLLGFTTLRARTVQDNPASAHVLASVGFQQEGESQPQVTPSGKTEMGVHYVMAL